MTQKGYTSDCINSDANSQPLGRFISLLQFRRYLLFVPDLCILHYGSRAAVWFLYPTSYSSEYIHDFLHSAYC